LNFLLPIESLTLHKLRPKGYENDAKMDSKMRDTYKMYAETILKKTRGKRSNKCAKMGAENPPEPDKMSKLCIRSVFFGPAAASECLLSAIHENSRPRGFRPSCLDPFSVPFWQSLSPQISKNVIWKYTPETMLEMRRQLRPKGHENDANMDGKIDEKNDATLEPANSRFVQRVQR